MLNGKPLGNAIKEAIELKLKLGKIRFKKDVSNHFGIKQPSMADWIKKGSIGKDKLPELWRYFSDVVGPEHWGMSLGEWPQELAGSLSIDVESRRIDDGTSTITKILPTPKITERDRALSLLMPIIEQLDAPSIDALRGAANVILSQMAAKQTLKSSS